MTDLLTNLVRNAERLSAAGHYDVEGAPRPGPGLSAALTRHHAFPIIAEVKLASPSKGKLTAHRPDALIDSYVESGAAGLSVLTEPERFLGSLETLRTATGRGTAVLMKDFVVSERQVEAAAALGAGTVLLIQEVFDIVPRSRRDELIGRARELGLEVLLEAGSESALGAAADSGADLLGINQRDLRTFSVDRGKGARLLPAALASGRPVVVMSGIEGRAAVEEVRDLGGSGVLVGSSLVASKDPAAALRMLEVPR
ncbi:MAG: indole-3-glycerol-phosphate synthase [Methanomassiliicoccus sp.]|nr:indole-3-glycerol-phosphate synthase [Methanomassiliicoccus sp.]